ncbi:hypothetical protein CKS_2606 [Pantoea stewartii subsp. stewartii DC283]|uniref:Uncharacterized protein n=1 Tax=Pantoea stewartii subsp. stewartii DC283 TaxID=660596 RepID=H3RDS0_PANSE|nr:hypothetical protein CKS_2606 [Pantoea stewartii subsp. stewartii DC283]
MRSCCTLLIQSQPALKFMQNISRYLTAIVLSQTYGHNPNTSKVSTAVFS